MEIILKFEMRMVELFLLIPDIGDSAANRAFNRAKNARQFVSRGTNLTANYNTVCVAKVSTPRALRLPAKETNLELCRKHGHTPCLDGPQTLIPM